MEPSVVPDFSKPGSEGTLPDGFKSWAMGCFLHGSSRGAFRVGVRKGVYVGASVLRNKPADRRFDGYAELYERATRIVKARVAELRCQDSRQFLHTRLWGHTWFRHGSTNLVRAAVTMGVTCMNNGDRGPVGESSPTREALAVQGGMTPEELMARSGIRKGFDEVYCDGDVRDESDSSGIFLFSYGEYVKTVEGIHYTPFVQRAENLSRFHLPFLQNEAATSSDQLNIVRREWFCTTSPDIAVIHIYVQR
jgi:hypothetical protein